MKSRKKIPLAERRGVFHPFNYRATNRLVAILVCTRVEKTSRALARRINAKVWEKSVYGKEVPVEGLFYNPFQLRGHDWTTVFGLLRTEEPAFSDSLAQQLSRDLKTKVIFFAYEGTSVILLLLLFDKGKIAEVLVNDGTTRRLKVLDSTKMLGQQKSGWPSGFYFYSRVRSVKPGSVSQQNFEAFVDDFFRRQNAWLAFDGASAESDGTATFTLDEGDDEDVLRADLVAVQPARILTKAQLRAEQRANDAAEMSNVSLGWATASADALPRSVKPVNREQAMQIHGNEIKKLKRLLKRKVRIRDYWLWEAAKVGNDDLAFSIIEAGNDLNVRPYGSTALEEAIEKRQIEIALALIKAGANLDLKGEWSGPPLLLATALRQTDVVRAMIEAGTDVNVRGDVSCGEESEELQQRLELRGVTRAYVPEAPFAEESTALIVAVRCGYPELVRMLLKAGSDPALVDKDGKTALQWGKQLKHGKIVALLEIPTVKVKGS